jgi:hypothetical protein
VLSALISLSSCGREKTIFELPDNYRVEAYWEATGFMDAGTIFEVYKTREGFWSIDKRVGYAVDWQNDRITGMSKPAIKILDNFLIIKDKYGEDTIPIKRNKY